MIPTYIFGLGGGNSFYEGVQHIRHPEPLHDPAWNYVVLAAAAVFEGISFTIALRVGIALSHWLQMPALDGAASVLIGILLASVAGLLARRARAVDVCRAR